MIYHLTSAADMSRSVVRSLTSPFHETNRWVVHGLFPDIVAEAKADPMTLGALPVLLLLLPLFMVVGYAYNTLTNGLVPTAKSFVDSGELTKRQAVLGPRRSGVNNK